MQALLSLKVNVREKRQFVLRKERGKEEEKSEAMNFMPDQRRLFTRTVGMAVEVNE